MDINPAYTPPAPTCLSTVTISGHGTFYDQLLFLTVVSIQVASQSELSQASLAGHLCCFKSLTIMYGAAGTAFLQICFPFGLFLAVLSFLFCQVFLYQKRSRYTVQLEICKCALSSTCPMTLGVTIVSDFRWRVPCCWRGEVLFTGREAASGRQQCRRHRVPRD